ncbi:uncharacterized protein Dwil_GK19014 [Drosophila willistoni]|uniref:Uncharacterized protein n=1 Tax=Drosophila willistoni TaxID=7260 RepID=B4MIT3_DROWI|nr:uncharacterized protein LOC6637871 [Drosophila willistoni]EDW72022.2 uncharacterized protein Dwil_GK19014 [Drosophila willistoni]
MQTSRNTPAIFLCCLVLLGPMMDMALSFNLEKAVQCAEILAIAGGAGLTSAPPIAKKFIGCTGFKATKTKSLDETDVFLLIGSLVQKSIANPSCVMSALSEVKKVVAPHVTKFIAAKCIN